MMEQVVQNGNDGDERPYQEEMTKAGFKVTWSGSPALLLAKYMIYHDSMSQTQFLHL